MAEEYYPIPLDPRYDIEHIRKLKNSDPGNAEDTFNPLIERILENIAAIYQKGATNAVISPTPPATGPALWFCSDPNWRPGAEPVATAILGDPAEADKADATAEVNEIVYPVVNASVAEEEGGPLIATIMQS